MGHEFREGRKVKYIFWPGKNNSIQIAEGEAVISMEPGQMGLVPWVLLETIDGPRLLNCAEMSVVEFYEEGD